MAKQTILVGAAGNDRTGDPLRSAFIKANANFTELYNMGAAQGVQGITGAQGTQGIQGRQGITGSQGTQGITGAGTQGAQGTQGIQGRQGIQGITGAGTQGTQGMQGAAGFVGSNGSQGAQGIEGSQGLQGAQGIEGSQGAQGIEGSQGAQGIEGSQGLQGAQGTEGSQGAQGIQGLKPLLNTLFLAGDYYFQAAGSLYNGPSPAGMEWSAGQVLSVWAPDIGGIVQHISITSYDSADGTLVATITDSSNPGYKTQAGVYISLSGQTGAQGLQGIEGSQGLQGTQGIEGSQGAQGIEGSQGLQGAQGIEGSQGAQGIEGSQGLQGAQGIEGSQGLQGAQGTILNFIGTWSAGSYVPNTVVVSPSNGNTYICIAIPADGGAIYIDPSANTDAWALYTSRGIQGAQGIEGSQGLQGAQGIEGSQGTQGIEGSQGLQGIQGSQGLQGIQGIRAAEDRLINGSYEVVLNATGELTFPEGANITDTATTLVLTPPGAAAGQSLVIRPTAATWTVTSSGYIEYGNQITISVNQNSSNEPYFGTVNYEITGTGVTSEELGRALTGNVVFSGVLGGGPETETVTWTIPANSNINEFTFTLTTVDGTESTGPGETDPALYYSFESNALPAGAYVTVDNNGISSSEHSHVHLISGNPVTTDIYLGDDDQFVKIEKNAGDVVIGTNTNTKNWRFDTDGKTLFPSVVWNYLPTTFTSVLVTYGETRLTFTVQPDNTFSNMSVAVGAGGYGPGSFNLTIPGTTFPGGATPANNIVFNVQTFETAGPVYSTDVASTVTYVSGTPPARYDNIATSGNLGLGAGDKHWVFDTDGDLTLPSAGDILDSTGDSVLFSGSYNDLSNKPDVASKTTGSWTVATGTNTYSITVPINGNYQMWVRCNIPNGIFAYQATVSVTNSNVPVLGTQRGYNYTGGGSPILLTTMPTQIIGAEGTISTAVVSTTTSNRFDFVINNASGSSQTVSWGYVTL